MFSGNSRFHAFKKVFSIFSLILLQNFSLSAEASDQFFSVNKINILELSDTFEKTSLKCHVNEIVAIKLPSDFTFIQGIEITVKHPVQINPNNSNFTWTIYDNCEISSENEILTFSAHPFYTEKFGTNRVVNIKIPLIKNNYIKKDMYSKLIENLPQLVKDSSGNQWLLFSTKLKENKLQKSDSETIELYLKPVLRNQGRIILNPIFPDKCENNIVTVQIDGNNYDFDEFSSKGLLLDYGEHTISFQSDFFRNELRSITIDQAKSVFLEVTFRDINPGIRIAAPSNAQVFLDDTEIENTTDLLQVTQGNHIIKFVMGNYEITKTFTAINGRNYDISINIDAFITEEN